MKHGEMILGTSASAVLIESIKKGEMVTVAEVIHAVQYAAANASAAGAARTILDVDMEAAIKKVLAK